MKKVLTKADKIRETIERVKDILERFNEQDETDEIKIKKKFFKEQLKDLEASYIVFKESNEPYYEPYTYEYYHQYFLKYSNYDLRLKDEFITEVTNIINDECEISKNTPSKKIKILENIIKAYNELMPIENRDNSNKM